ncbi:MAG: hypothetical protein QHJ73_01635 [Armatimonadota bacterium]|nr:hypothetical protein [Armatimonadota bacterium]
MSHAEQSARLRRREFLVRSAAAVSTLATARAVRAAEAPTPTGPLPSIPLGPHRISRLVAGWNPIGGHSHTTLDMAEAMREYFTTERLVEFLERCFRSGITTWQFDYTEKSVAAIRQLRERGVPMQLICLHAERAMDVPLQQVIADTKPIAIVHHGGVTDSKFRAGRAQDVRDFVKKVKDRGVLAGVSSHNPDNIRRVADEGWENDLFMCCFYNVSRSDEEQRKLLGTVTVGEPFLQCDPPAMTQVMRQVKQPCLGFKILAAGRACWSKRGTEQAFQWAFQNIKPTDGVIVGMFPRYSDQVSENAGYVRRFGASL